MTTLSKRYRFCASHRLHADSLSDAENESTYGKCNNPFGHGHDYSVDISVTGQVDSQTGVVIPLPDLDRFVAAEILTGFAYRNLNTDVAEFQSLVPTTENLALVIAARLGQRWSDYFPNSSARLSGIFIQETDRNSFEVHV